MKLCKQRLLLFGFLYLSILVSSGCLAAVGGAALGGTAYAYHKGNVTTVVEAEFAETWQATKNAMNDLALPLKGEKRTGVGGTIESATHDGTKIVITIEEKPLQTGMTCHQTSVGVRVGIFGDQNASQRLLEQMHQHLAMRKSNPLPLVSPTAQPRTEPPPVPAQERNTNP